MVGGRLAHYAVTETIGAGGMGVVYRARDEKLRRDVALKVLPPERMEDATARARLLNEARAASALNHANICTVYEVGEADGQAYIAMEAVPGKVLKDLIPSQGLPTESLLHIGLQVAAALAHAHERGILHRDLKASNVMVTPENQAKVLDFGLAKRLDRPEDLVTVSKTEADLSLTAPGRIVGTVPCMSPEQLRDEPVDARSDIWAFGVLLYEMASGERPFRGKTSIELCSAILHDPPAPLPARVPPGLRSIIQRCLAKAAGQRYQRASEVLAALDALYSASGIQIAIDARTTQRKTWAGAAALGIVLAVVGAAVGLRLGRRSAPATGVGGGQLSLLFSTESDLSEPALSPDGRVVAYVAQEGGSFDLFISRVAGGPRVRLTSDPAREGRPSFSPDGERLAFARLGPEPGAGEICVIPTFGGQATPVISGGTQPAWSQDGRRIAFVRRRAGEPDALATSGADGTDPRELLHADGTYPFLASPAWSPDGSSIVFLRSLGGVAREVWRVPAKGGAPERLWSDPTGVFSDTPVFTADGTGIVHVSNRGGATNLWLMPLRTQQPLRLTSGPGPDLGPSVAQDGSLVFLSSRSRNALLVYPLGGGEPSTLLTHASAIWAPRFSPDATEIAFSRLESDGSWHVWSVPAEGGAPRQLTSGRVPEIYPSYTPDGASLVFFTWSQQPSRVYRVPRGGGAPEPVTPPEANDAYPDLSPDGRRIAFARTQGDDVRVHVMDLPRGKSRPATKGPSTVPRFSPDGKWIAYSPDRSYSGGVFVVAAEGGEPRRLAETGGWPMFWPDGRRLGYQAVGPDGNTEIRVVPAGGGPSAPLPGIRFLGTNYPFDVSRDGRRLVTSNTVSVSNEIWRLGSEKAGNP